MSDQRQSYAVKRVDARCMLENHLRQLQGQGRYTIAFHRRVITRLLSFLTPRSRHAGTLLCFSAGHLLRWIVVDVQDKRNSYAASRLQVVDHYLRLLCERGMLPDHPLQQIRAGAGNPSWNYIVEISQSPQPLRQLQQLQPRLPRRGPLYPSINKYVELHQSLGKKYTAHRQVLHAFDSFLAEQQVGSVESIRALHLRCWIDRMSCTPGGRRRKLSVIKRCMDYLVGVGAIQSNPAALVLTEFGRPRKKKFRPSILTPTQIAAILKWARRLSSNHLFKLRPHTCYTMILLLYTLGLRSREVRHLRFCNVDMERGTIRIEATKFHKSRLVPFGPSVRECLSAYLVARRKIFLPIGSDDPLFVTCRRQPIGGSALGDLFRTLARKVMPQASPLPRVHDLRHTFAVHRLLQWYREGVDVQSKLILLSTFMGHTEIKSTEVYLTITMELLAEASGRFYQHCGALLQRGQL